MQTYDNISDMSSEEFYLDVAVTNLSKSEIDPQLGVLSCDIEFTCLSPWYKLFPDLKLTTLYATENGTYAPPSGYDGYGAVIADVEDEGSNIYVDNFEFEYRGEYAHRSLNKWYNYPIEIDESLTNCTYLMANKRAFNQPVNIPQGVVDVGGMFSNCWSLNQPISIPNTVIYAGTMFDSCPNFNYPISIPESVQYANAMFNGCHNFNQPITIPNGILYTAYMFNSCINFNQPVRIPGSVIDAQDMFFSPGINYSAFNSPVVIENGVQSVSSMFYRCGNFNQPLYVPDSCIYWTNILRNAIRYNSTISVPNNKYNFCGLNSGGLYTSRKVTFRDTGLTYRSTYSGWVIDQ